MQVNTIETTDTLTGDTEVGMIFIIEDEADEAKLFKMFGIDLEELEEAEDAEADSKPCNKAIFNNTRKEAIALRNKAADAYESGFTKVALSYWTKAVKIADDVLIIEPTSDSARRNKTRLNQCRHLAFDAVVTAAIIA